LSVIVFSPDLYCELRPVLQTVGASGTFTWLFRISSTMKVFFYLIIVTINRTSTRFCFRVFVALFFYSVVNPETYLLFFATKALRHQEAQKFIVIHLCSKRPRLEIYVYCLRLVTTPTRGAYSTTTFPLPNLLPPALIRT